MPLGCSWMLNWNIYVHLASIYILWYLHFPDFWPHLKDQLIPEVGVLADSNCRFSHLKNPLRLIQYKNTKLNYWHWCLNTSNKITSIGYGVYPHNLMIRWYVNVDIDIWTKLQLILNFIPDNYWYVAAAIMNSGNLISRSYSTACSCKRLINQSALGL